MLDTGRAAPPGRMPWSAGEGHGPPANPELPQAGPIWNRPLQGLWRGGGMRFPGCPPARPSAVGADSISARGTLRRRGFSGAVAAFSQICRAGVHARRTTAISKRKRSRRPGLQRLQQCGVRDFTGGCKPAVGRRGGIYPSRGRSRRRGARRDEGIPPYGRRGGDGNPFGRNVYHGSQGRAMPLPQNLFQHYEPPAGRRSTLSKL